MPQGLVIKAHFLLMLLEALYEGLKLSVLRNGLSSFNWHLCLHLLLIDKLSRKGIFNHTWTRRFRNDGCQRNLLLVVLKRLNCFNNWSWCVRVKHNFYILTDHFIYYLMINIWGHCAHLMLQLPCLQIGLRYIIKSLRLYTDTTITTHLGSSKLGAPWWCWLLKLLVVLLILLMLNERSKVALSNWFNFTL